MTVSERFKRFQFFNFETNFWGTKTFFKKLENQFFVETTKIENTSFPFKTALSEADVKINGKATTKWTYHKEWRFASNLVFHFFEKIIPVLEPLELIWCTSEPNFNISIFCKRWSLICEYALRGCFFSASILKMSNMAHFLYLLLADDSKELVAYSLRKIFTLDSFRKCYG